jgi:hypothetical protein
MGAPLLTLLFRPPQALAGLALLVCGSCFAYQLGIQQAFLDSLPERRRGQGFGLNSTGAMGGQGLIPVAVGALAGALGAAPAMAIAGAATILAALALRRPLTGAKDQTFFNAERSWYTPRPRFVPRPRNRRPLLHDSGRCGNVSDYERGVAEPGLRRAAR